MIYCVYTLLCKSTFSVSFVTLCGADHATELSSWAEQVVQTCIDVYNTITTQLLPTPSKSHYTFNLRDLSKVIQGLLMADASQFEVSLK